MPHAAHAAHRRGPHHRLRPRERHQADDEPRHQLGALPGPGGLPTAARAARVDGAAVPSVGARGPAALRRPRQPPSRRAGARARGGHRVRRVSTLGTCVRRRARATPLLHRPGGGLSLAAARAPRSRRRQPRLDVGRPRQCAAASGAHRVALPRASPNPSPRWSRWWTRRAATRASCSRASRRASRRARASSSSTSVARCSFATLSRTFRTARTERMAAPPAAARSARRSRAPTRRPRRPPPPPRAPSASCRRRPRAPARPTRRRASTTRCCWAASVSACANSSSCARLGPGARRRAHRRARAPPLPRRALASSTSTGSAWSCATSCSRRARSPRASGCR